MLTQELKKRNLTYRLSGNKIIIISADADKGSSKKVTVKGQIKDEKENLSLELRLCWLPTNQ